jgi:hypothetical protein
MAKLSTLAKIASTFPLRDGALRLSYELQRGSGLMSGRMRSARGWDRWKLGRIAPGITSEGFLHSRRNGEQVFFFADARALAPELKKVLGPHESTVRAEAESILTGKLPFFGGLSFECGFPPNWFRNPLTGQQVSPDRPWTTMRFASADYGDLKFILEPSRFLFVYPLARAYALTGEERFPQAFWTLLEDWARTSPPMSGPLWVCGQESSLRILAWSFAFHAFLGSPATTAERAALLLSLVAAHAWRAQQTVGYARSQRSNHLFSEAAGLWTAGTLYPELSAAAAWRELGMRLLQEAALDQITPEGVHLQYSFNYQRMVLQLLLWTVRLAQIRGVRLPAEIQERTRKGFELLRTFVDSASGQAPNYGSNDGSLILPLSVSDYGDFRPLIQTGSLILTGAAGFEPGPWDEAALWLGAKLADTQTTVTATATAVPFPAVTGYHRLGNANCWALVRAGHYHRRPFQADQLHVDLWHNGLNLARDAGTYLYNGEPPWDNGMSRTLVHNTVSVDGQDQMRRAGRFLWVDWAQASGRSFSPQGVSLPDRFEGEHDGYRSLGVKHRRSVQWLENVGWVILDDLVGSGEHTLRLHWLVPDLPSETSASSPFRVTFRAGEQRFDWSVFASAPGHGDLMRAGKSSMRGAACDDVQMIGWESPTYGSLRPAVSVIYKVHASLPVRLATVILTGSDSRLESGEKRFSIWRDEECLYDSDMEPGKPDSRSNARKLEPSPVLEG